MYVSTYLYIHASMHENMEACMHMCVFIYIDMCIHVYQSLYFCVTIHNFDASHQKYGCNTANMSHTVLMLNWHKEPTFLTHTETQSSAISTSHVSVMYVLTTNTASNAMYMPHMPITSCACMTQ